MAQMERLVQHSPGAHSKATGTASPEGWEIVIDRPHLKVWRRFMKEYNLFEYRGQWLQNLSYNKFGYFT